MPKLTLDVFNYEDDQKAIIDKLNELTRQLEYGINRDKYDTLSSYNGRSSRISDAIILPTIAGDGTAVDHVINTDGSATISLEWSWTGNDADIDGWRIFTYRSDSNAEYNFGDNASEELIYQVPAEKRVLIFTGPADKYYTLGVQAYRVVDPDISSSRLITTAIVKPAAAGENPYQPSANVEFSGDVTGTVAGVPGDQISKTGSTFIIGDTDTSTNIKRADYVVPSGSTSSQDTINQVISEMGSAGGKIELLDGTFMISGSIILPSNVTLQGQGNATIIKAINTQNVSNMVTNSDTVTGNINISVKDILFDGNKNIAELKGGNVGIYLENVTNCNIATVQIMNMRSRGVSLNAATNNIISQNIINNIGYTAGAGVGVYLYNVSEGNVIKGNIFNIIQGIDSGAIRLLADNNTVMGNSCHITTYGIFICSHYNTVNGNTCFENLRGIYVESGNKNDITGNTCRLNSRQGIYLYGSSDNNISNNTCLENSQQTNNTYDNICIDNSSDGNNVQSNVCRKGSLSNEPRYGINVASADCENNIVTNNDLLTSGASGSLSDSGTGTITTAGNRL